jgi:hypothetical protein
VATTSSSVAPRAAAGGCGGVDHAHPLPALALALELLDGLLRRLNRSRDPAGDVDRHHVVAAGQQGLPHPDEVPDRGLRRGGQLLGAAELVEEGVVVGDVRLAHGALAAEHDVERNEMDVVCLGEITGQVTRAIGHDGYGHGGAAYRTEIP